MGITMNGNIPAAVLDLVNHLRSASVSLQDTQEKETPKLGDVGYRSFNPSLSIGVLATHHNLKPESPDSGRFYS